MILKNFYDDKLAQASYLVGCAATGESVVVDPNRDVEQYVEAAERHALRITHVTETHIHADFVSGSRELAERTGATLYLSDEGGDEWKYAFAEGDAAVLLKDGDAFDVGNIHIEAIHTPGHTPEHLSFVVTDRRGADRPMGVFTGDFVFVGDVGRPDLLERAARVEGTMEAAARDLFRSIQRFKESLPDFVQLWPGHGAGSACGKSLGAVPQSTLGYEKLFNWGLSATDEAGFVKAVLTGQPEPPTYFADMKRINREGPPVLGEFVRPPHLPESRLADLMSRGELVVDTRTAAEYGAEHVPGTINIPLNRSFNTWAGWLVPFGAEFHLIVGDGGTRAIDEAVRDLAKVGLDGVAGYFSAQVLEDWKNEGRGVEQVVQLTADELAGRMKAGGVEVVDVRGRAEWEAGHIPGVENIPVGHLPDRIGKIPSGAPVVVYCQSGGRSAIASSVLQAHGISTVLNYAGGYQDWVARGLPVEPASRDAGGAATA